MFRKKPNPAVPLPWQAGRRPPAGFTRPPTTSELLAQRRATQTPRWHDDTSDASSDVSTDPTNLGGVSTFGCELDDAEHDDEPADAWGDEWDTNVSTTRTASVEGFSGHDGSRGGREGSSAADELAVYVGRPTDIVFGRGRVAVLGDVGGVLSCFEHALGRLGVVGDVIPPGLTVVQVGDLIGGQGHDGVLLDRVDALMTTNPGSWVQLAGNWESRHLPGFVRFDPRKERVSLRPVDVALLGSWWRDGHLRVAAAIDTPAGEVLITHAGLTGGLWHTLGCPSSASAAAELLNEMALYVPQVIGAPGEMMHAIVDGHVVAQRRLAAGPLWASASELWSSWATEPVMPFDQVVGHTAPWYFNRGHWSPHLRGVDESLLTRSIPDASSRHVLHTHRCGRVIRSIDCGLHAHAPAHLLRPWQVDRTQVL